MAQRQPGSSVHSHTQAVGWLELFFDLVFVAAVVAFSDAISSHPTVENLLWVAAAFVAAWLVWFGTVLCFNQDRRDDAADRALVVIMMIAFSLGAIAVGEGPGVRRYLVASMFALMLFALALLNLRAASVHPNHARFIRERAVMCVVAGVLIGTSVLLPDPWHVIGWWMAVVIVGGLWAWHAWHSRTTLPPVDEGHLSERMGLLTIIVLGEAFVKLAIVASGAHIDALDISVVVAMFCCVFGVFWAYFDDVPIAGISPTPARRLSYFTGHIALQGGCIGLAIGMAGLIAVSDGELTWKIAGFTAGALSLIYFGFALIGLGTRRTNNRSSTVLRIISCLVLVASVPAVATWSWLGPNATAYLLAGVVLVHGVIAQQLRKHTRLDHEAPMEIVR